MSSVAPGRPELEVTSTANPRIKALSALYRRRERDRRGVTVVEGYEELTLALDAGVRPHALYYCPDLVAGPERLATVGRISGLGAEIVRVSRAVFEKIAYRESPDGWLAEAPMPPARLDDVRVGSDPLLLVCEGVEKPGNLGAMLRTADAAGLAAVIAAGQVADWGNPNVVRASKGAVFSVPVAAAPSALALDWLADRGVRVVAATPDTDTLFTEVDYRGPVAIAVGSEKHGLSEEWLSRADDRVRIPMFGLANSLNVATSAAILVYEALRQRSWPQQSGVTSPPAGHGPRTAEPPPKSTR